MLHRRSFVSCLLLAVFSLPLGSDSFAPSYPSSSSSTGTGWVNSRKSSPFLQPKTCTTTGLRMGIMEDFLTGQDDASRERENKEYLATLEKRVERINALEVDIEELDDEELEEKSNEFRQRLAKGEDLNGPLLEEAFAVVREAAWYVLFVSRGLSLLKLSSTGLTYAVLLLDF